MKLIEYFGELKTPMKIAAEYIAAAYFNEDLGDIDQADLQNYVKQCNINSYELVFHATNEIEARTLSNIADITRDYPILNTNWVNTRIDHAKIERDLRIILNFDIPSEDWLAAGRVVEESPRPKQNAITQDFDKMRQRSKDMGPMEQELYPDVPNVLK